MPTHTPLAPQIEQFIHDNPQGVLSVVPTERHAPAQHQSA